MNGMLERILPYRRPLIVLAHALLVTAAFAISFALRFDVPLPDEEWDRLIKSLPVILAVRLLVFYRSGVYQGLWRYVDARDLVTLVKAISIGTLVFVAVVMATGDYGFPRMVFALDWLLCIIAIGGSRFAVRVVREARARRRPEPGEPTRVLVIGAGRAGRGLVREIQDGHDLNYEVVGLLDDDKAMRGRRVHGVSVVGTVGDTVERARALEADEIFVAVPSAAGEERRRITGLAVASGLPVKRVPTLAQIVQGRRLAQLEEVTPEDLLGREPVQVDVKALREQLEGKTVLITGAAGSIGSELARQVAQLDPARLVLLDRSESSLYFTELKLKQEMPAREIVAVVGDVRETAKVEEVFGSYEPEIVYHAAAYKHVPLMERFPLDAIENNIVGTETVAEAAMRHGTRRFVFVSTDKAVRPIGIMGMTKRVAEDLLRSYPSTPTLFVAVRFGNVLGSEGSVLPLFQRQLALGGPLTITDPAAARYFMLVEEAAQLVLQAGSQGSGGDVFLLDMGSEISVADLADSLIRLSGYEPGKDMHVETIGLREGERLREHLVRETEDLLASDHEKVYLAQQPPVKAQAFHQDYEALKHLLGGRQEAAAVELLRVMSARY
jgi:FlaA1/EpsC-like NDP-sugar epimerase